MFGKIFLEYITSNVISKNFNRINIFYIYNRMYIRIYKILKTFFRSFSDQTSFKKIFKGLVAHESWGMRQSAAKSDCASFTNKLYKEILSKNDLVFKLAKIGNNRLLVMSVKMAKIFLAERDTLFWDKFLRHNLFPPIT